MPRILITVGLVFVTVGLMWHFGAKFGLGNLPGDINIRRNNLTIHFPIVTSVILSIALTVLLWIISRFNR